MKFWSVVQELSAFLGSIDYKNFQPVTAYCLDPILAQISP